MFFKRTNQTDPKLSDVVKKVVRTDYIFYNINEDLGQAADQVMQSSPHLIMSYGYARRASIAALYLQGFVDRGVFDYVTGIFKALQQRTGHTVEFQEGAGSESIKFMQEYHYLISTLFVKKLVLIAQEYDVPSRQSERLSDADLFKEVTDTIYAEQEALKKA